MDKSKIYSLILDLLKAAKAKDKQFQELIAKNQPKTYLTVGQHWRNSYSMGTKYHQNPLATKAHLTHLSDLDALKEHFAPARQTVDARHHDHPVKLQGKETYEIGPDNSLKFVHAAYDTSD